MFGAICANRPVQTNLQILSPTQFVFLIPPDPPFTHIVVFLLPDQLLFPDTGAAVYIRFPPPPSSSLSAAQNTNATLLPQQQQFEFTFLGAIGNEKQSAIFRVRHHHHHHHRGGGAYVPTNGGATTAPNTSSMMGNDVVPQQQEEDQDLMIDSSTPTTTTTTTTNQTAADPTQMITLGISLEPLDTIRSLLEQHQNQTHNQTSTPIVVPPSTSATTAALAKPALSTKVLAQRIIQNAFNYLASFAVRPDGATTGEEMIPLKAFREWWNKFEKKLLLDDGFLERD
ncbi:MAG: hypothetical protein M1816_005755 [Peltula sp. TS41687]|nr:MAG: hypothetical protein M1816_005755 [Peltula sp. TS41687]